MARTTTTAVGASYRTVIFDSAQPKFANAIVAGVVEHNSGTTWHAVRGKGAFVNGKPTRASGKTQFDRKTLTLINHFGAEGDSHRLTPLHRGVWVKDFGTAALHFAGISSGAFDAYVGYGQKAHELGAGFLLVKESGGSITDFHGKPLDRKRYNFDAMYRIIAAGSPALREEIRRKITR